MSPLYNKIDKSKYKKLLKWHIFKKSFSFNRLYIKKGVNKTPESKKRVKFFMKKD